MVKGKPLKDSEPGAVKPDVSKAEIDVAQIGVPMLLVCGEADKRWPSCDSAKRIAELSPDLPRKVVAEPDAGHMVGFVAPGYPMLSGDRIGGDGAVENGGTTQADWLGRVDAMDKVLRFLKGLSDAPPPKRPSRDAGPKSGEPDQTEG